MNIRLLVPAPAASRARRAKSLMHATPSCRSTSATSSPRCWPTTTSPHSNTWRRRAWARIHCGRSPPTSAISRPGVGSRPAPPPLAGAGSTEILCLPPLGSGQARRGSGAHGIPAAVEAGLRAERLLKATGPHAPHGARRLTSRLILTRWRGLTGAFGAPSLRSALRLAVRASDRPRQRKSRKAVTGDVLARLLEACASDRLVDVRDRALLLTAFASGGRRRSEVAALRVENFVDEEPVRADPADRNSPPLPCLSIHLGRAKTRSDDDEPVLLIGRR